MAGRVSCFDAATGEPHSEQQRHEIPGPCFAAPGRIYLVNVDCKTAILTAGLKPGVLWRADFHERITLYVRTATNLFACKERK